MSKIRRNRILSAGGHARCSRRPDRKSTARNLRQFDETWIAGRRALAGPEENESKSVRSVKEVTPLGVIFFRFGSGIM
jgi:hypothetical protein